MRFSRNGRTSITSQNPLRNCKRTFFLMGGVVTRLARRRFSRETLRNLSRTNDTLSVRTLVLPNWLGVLGASLQSSVLMYCTGMESVALPHTTYYTQFKYLRYTEIHLKGFQKVWTLIARDRKLADIFCGHFLRTLISGHYLRSGIFCGHLHRESG